MKFAYVDTGNRDWSALSDVVAASCCIDNLDESSVLFLHASDWTDVENVDSTYTVGKLRDTIKDPKANARKAQIVFFSGDYTTMLRDHKDTFLNQLRAWGYEGEAYFVEHNVESPCESFGTFVSVGKSSSGVVLARDILPQEIEVMNVAFALLLDTYLIANLEESDVPEALRKIREQINKTMKTFDSLYWAPATRSGQLDTRLSAYVNGSGLNQLDRHSFETQPNPLLLDNVKEQLRDWFCRRHAELIEGSVA